MRFVSWDPKRLMEKTMAEVVYVCCTVVSLCCTALLLRTYMQSRARLILWCTLSFVFLSLNHLFICVDLILFPDLDLWGSIVRNALFAMAGSVLVFGLAWELS